MMWRILRPMGVVCSAGLFGVWACGGSTPAAQQPEPMQEPEPAYSPPVPTDAASVAEEPEAEAEPAEPAEPAAAEPKFTDGMSVRQAIDAVPQGTPTMNIEQDVLSKPLEDVKLYEPCKLSQAQHFDLKVAIWRAKAVGIDVVTTPKNAGLEQCLRQQIKGVTWEEDVPSLNTIEYSF